MAKQKIRTLAELANAIDAELGWRKRELSYLKTAINKNSSYAQATYIRASVALLYAHWEGYVVGCLRAYVNYVVFQKPQLSSLVPQLRVGAMLSGLKRVEREHGASARAALLKDYDAALNLKADLKADRFIDAESNLNAVRFIGLVECAGIDVAYFESASIFLDESLLARRNCICHGETLEIDAATYVSVEDQVLELMERVKDHALDSAQNKKYLLKSL